MSKYKKRIMVLSLGTLGMILLSGCGSKQVGSRVENRNQIDQVMESQIAAGQDKKKTSEEETKQEETSKTTKESSKTTEETKQTGDVQKTEQNSGVDIDLTVMDSDMVYATVYQLMFNPEDYQGKTVKMRGNYYATWYERTKKYYHCVIIQDATACCSQGMEFLWGDGSHVYPDEYPENETEVEVIGEFEIYSEDGYDYCRLKNADLSVVTES